jgi:hypothetical protein
MIITAASPSTNTCKTRDSIGTSKEEVSNKRGLETTGADEQDMQDRRGKIAPSKVVLTPEKRHE